MNFDRFIELLNSTPEFKDFWVEHARFKHNELVEAEVHFTFEPTYNKEESYRGDAE